MGATAIDRAPLKAIRLAGEDNYGPGDTHELVLGQLAHHVDTEGLFQRLRVVLAQPLERGDGVVR